MSRGLSSENNTSYTNILREILKTDSYKQIKENLEAKDATFSDGISYLKNLGLIRKYKKRNSKLVIYYPGCTQYIFQTFFANYRRTYYKVNKYHEELPVIGGLPLKIPKIIYKSGIMEKLIFEHLKYELLDIKQDISIKELFERLVIDTGNWLLEMQIDYRKFRKHYRVLKKKKMEHLLKELYREQENEPFFNRLMLENLDNHTKHNIMETTFGMIQNGYTKQTINAVVPFKFFSLIYTAELNKINLVSLLWKQDIKQLSNFKQED